MKVAALPADLWEQVWPFLLTVVLTVLAALSAPALNERVARGFGESIGRQDLYDEEKDYLRRACLYFADIGLLYTIVPVLLALYFDTAGGVTLISALYWICVGVTAISVVVVLVKVSPKKYNRSRFWLTKVEALVIGINVVALVVALVDYAISGK